MCSLIVTHSIWMFNGLGKQATKPWFKVGQQGLTASSEPVPELAEGSPEAAMYCLGSREKRYTNQAPAHARVQRTSTDSNEDAFAQ